MGINIDFLLYQSDIITVNFRWFKLSYLSYLHETPWSSPLAFFGENRLASENASCLSWLTMLLVECFHRHYVTLTHPHQRHFPHFTNEQKEAMGGNELLKVRKIKHWMAGPRSDLSSPIQCFFHCFVFRSGVGGRDIKVDQYPTFFLFIHFPS